MTTYVVLQLVPVDADPMDDGEAWVEAARIEARSDSAAIREFKGNDGQYVAVPVRSWRPRTVKAEQTTRLTIT